MYVSRIDGDAITYDVRMVVSKAGVYLENDGIHTFEHLLATYVRNTADSDNILYVGPMGCRTGFYFITRDKISKARAIELVQETCEFSKTLKERLLVLVVSNAETIWTTACQKQKNMPKISPRHLSAGPKTRWFINCNFGRRCLIRQRETYPLPRFYPKGQNFPFIFICYFSFFY